MRGFLDNHFHFNEYSIDIIFKAKDMLLFPYIGYRGIHFVEYSLKVKVQKATLDSNIPIKMKPLKFHSVYNLGFMLSFVLTKW